MKDILTAHSFWQKIKKGMAVAIAIVSMWNVALIGADAAIDPASIVNTSSANSFVSDAVARVGNAVVRIDTEKTITREGDPFLEDWLSGNLPQQERLRGQGSGFIIDANGTIVTNAHVVNGADRVTVTLKDGRNFPAKVSGVDSVTDLAVVKVEGTNNLPTAALGNSDTVRVGDWAIAVGNPFGLDNTVTLGIVSTLKRSSAAVGMSDKRLDFIQTDAAINPGNSGGPLLNASGEVIGINTAIRADAMGIGFAIPIDKAKQIATTLARGEKVSHPYLGIQMATLTPDIAAENNEDPNSPFRVPAINGVLVMRVLPNTAAAKAGLHRGDTIVEIDKAPVKSAAELQDIVENSRINQRLQVRIVRDGMERSVSITPRELN
jgi:S1-C subfamily serine protease